MRLAASGAKRLLTSASEAAEVAALFLGTPSGNAPLAQRFSMFVTSSKITSFQ
jgi:hypothetical protein